MDENLESVTFIIIMFFYSFVFQIVHITFIQTETENEEIE